MTKLIIANWKMQLTVKESLLLAKKFKASTKLFQSKMVVCPDYLALPLIIPLFKSSPIEIGAQDCATANCGAYTGEVSPLNLKTMGVKYVIIGHSERREKLGETDELINAKIKAALENKLVPVLCIGEKLVDKKNGRAKLVLANQLRGALKNIKIIKATDLTIAYEPLWAIGTGQAIIPAEAGLINIYIISEAAKILHKNVRVIYGGSVDLNNASEFLSQKDIAGLLVGGASLKENFSKLCY